MSTKDITAAIVIYNMHCADSPTCRFMAKADGVRVLIYDNSTSDFGNRQYCEQNGFVYLGGNGNDGISKAYNGCVDWLKNNNINGLICLFDDDTDVDNEYFEVLIKTAEQTDGKIFVPLIYSASRILSPCIITKKQKIKIFDTADMALCYRGDDITAINSGMAIDLSVFDDYRYDENIFLDGVDHHFVTDMAKRGIALTVMPYSCEHSFSGDEIPPMQSALNRFKIYAKDYAYILKDKRSVYNYLVGKRALKLTLQYKTFKFIKAMEEARFKQ